VSKKPHRSRHRVPTLAAVVSDPVDERYQCEVDYSTARLEKAWRKAQAGLEAAERRSAKAAQVAHRSLHNVRLQREHQRLIRLVEVRRAELREVEKLMTPEAYASRDGRRRLVRHETGDVMIPLGGTTGQCSSTRRVPVFPVTVTQKPRHKPNQKQEEKG